MPESIMPPGAIVTDPEGNDVGRVEEVISTPEEGPTELHVALLQGVLHEEEAPSDLRLLRVPIQDVTEQEDGRLTLKAPWRNYRGQESPAGT